MNIEKITVNGHYVWVDKDAEIKEGDWFLPISGTGWELNKPRRADNNGGYNNDHCKKIIAASPKLHLESVPNYTLWFIENVKPSEPKELFTEDDVRFIILKSFLLGVDRGEYSRKIEDSIIKQLKQGGNK